MGELTLSFASAASVYATNEDAPSDSFHLIYSGDAGVSLSREPALVDVNLLLRSSKTPALVGDSLVTFCSDHGELSSPDVFVSNGRQCIPLVGNANLEPGDLLGLAAASLLLRVPFDALVASPLLVYLRLRLLRRRRRDSRER